MNARSKESDGCWRASSSAVFFIYIFDWLSMVFLAVSILQTVRHWPNLVRQPFKLATNGQYTKVYG
jgi:hypothetical protein